MSKQGTTNDGLQGSQTWLQGGNRLSNAVGDDAVARDIDKAIRAGRTKTWLVRTLPDGSTELKVLDAMGKPKPVDTSKIILPGTNAFGVQR